MSTYAANAQNLKREWLVVDVADIPLGRAASQVASVLRGKHKPTYTPNFDAGDYVIVLNSDKVVFTGKKMDKKVLRHHTFYPGGLKEIGLRKMMNENSDRVFVRAVKGMLPKSALGKNMLKKLRVFKGGEHGHEAQQPREYKLVKKY